MIPCSQCSLCVLDWTGGGGRTGTGRRGQVDSMVGRCGIHTNGRNRTLARRGRHQPIAIAMRNRWGHTAMTRTLPPPPSPPPPRTAFDARKLRRMRERSLESDRTRSNAPAPAPARFGADPDGAQWRARECGCVREMWLRCGDARCAHRSLACSRHIGRNAYG